MCRKLWNNLTLHVWAAELQASIINCLHSDILRKLQLYIRLEPLDAPLIIFQTIFKHLWIIWETIFKHLWIDDVGGTQLRLRTKTPFENCLAKCALFLVYRKEANGCRCWVSWLSRTFDSLPLHQLDFPSCKSQKWLAAIYCLAIRRWFLDYYCFQQKHFPAKCSLAS